MSSRWSALKAEHADIIALTAKLLASKDEDVQTRASTIRTNTGTIFSSLKNINEGRLYGSNNPKIRSKIEYGKSQHVSEQNNLCSGNAEISLWSGSRIDCVVVRGGTCTIYEIKPGNSRAMSTGLRRANDYAAEVEAEYAAVANKTPPERAAKFDGRRAVFLSCVDANNTLRITPAVHPYPYCPTLAEVTDGP